MVHWLAFLCVSALLHFSDALVYRASENPVVQKPAPTLPVLLPPSPHHQYLDHLSGLLLEHPHPLVVCSYKVASEVSPLLWTLMWLSSLLREYSSIQDHCGPHLI